MSQTQRSITVRDVLKVLFRRKLIIALTLLASIGSVYLGMKWRTPAYFSEVTMLVSAKKQVEATYYRELLDFRQAEIALTQSEIVRSVAVLEPVVRSLRLDRRGADYEMQYASTIKQFFKSRLADLRQHLDAVYEALGIADPPLPLPPDVRSRIDTLRAIEALKTAVSVNVIKGTDLFVIGVEDYDPIAAAIIANVISRSYIVFDLEQQLAEIRLKYGEKHFEVLQIRDNISQVREFMDGRKLKNVDAIGPASVKIVSQASIPLAPMGKSVRFVLLLASALGIAMGFVLAFVSDYFDQTVNSPYDVESDLDIPFIAHVSPKSLPKDKSLLTSMSEKARAGGRVLSDHLLIVLRNSNTNMLLLAESGEKARGPALTVQIATAMAEQPDRRVLLIDADFRQPSFHPFLEDAAHPGLSELLEAKAELEDAVVSWGTNCFFLPKGCGTINPSTYLSSRGMVDLLARVRSEYDIVLIYCSSIGNARDVIFLTKTVPDITIFINAQKNRKMALQRNLNELRKNGARIAGAILSGPRASIPGIIYNRL